MSAVNEKIVQLIFNTCFQGKKTTVGIKICKREKTSIVIVNEEAKAKFLMEDDKKEFK